MRAVYYKKYGVPSKVLTVKEMDKPIPKAGEVLIKVHAASVNAADWRSVKCEPFMARAFTGFFSPKNKIPGGDMAGVVEAVGEGVSQFKGGDKVYGCLVDSGAGAFAEYACAMESVIAPMPNGMTFEDAAALPLAAVTALQGINSAQVKVGQKVLINGASGGVGIFAVQIAKALGAETTAVCSTKAVDTLKQFVDHVIDYKKENWFESGMQYDVIIDVASTSTVEQYRDYLPSGGNCVVIGHAETPAMSAMLKIGMAKEKDGKKIKMLMAKNNSQSDLLVLNKLVEEGKLKAIIDSRYPLEEIATALEHIEKGHPVGKVVIEIAK